MKKIIPYEHIPHDENKHTSKEYDHVCLFILYNWISILKPKEFIYLLKQNFELDLLIVLELSTKWKWFLPLHDL
jgi:hypothetical protein